LINRDEPDYSGKALSIGNADGPIPSYLGSQYGRPAFRAHPSAYVAWMLVIGGLAVLPLVLVAVPLAVRAGWRGNRLAWLVLPFAAVDVAAAVAMGSPFL
jgi:hypothetical protein